MSYQSGNLARALDTAVQDAPLQVAQLGRGAADLAEWDELVARSGGTFCHLSAWRKIMEDVFGHRTYFLTARNSDGAVEGVLPLVSIRSKLLGNFLLSMPCLNYGGPLGSDAARVALCEEATRIADSTGVDVLELRARDAEPPVLTPAARKIAVIVPLAPTVEEQWEKRFKSKLRGKIKRPMNHGMEVRFGAAELDPFYEIFARNMRDLGTPVLPRQWFEAIRDAFGDTVIFASVYSEGIAVASGCGFMYGDEFEITWSSALREHNSKHPNMLLSWALMQESIRRGATAFNFGRSTPGSNTHEYKQQWGGHDIPLPWAIWGKQSGQPDQNSTKFRIATAIWSRLPVGLTKRIGPALARQLPL
jgi:serine/alanine adding enzyme